MFKAAIMTNPFRIPACAIFTNYINFCMSPQDLCVHACKQPTENMKKYRLCETK